MEITEIVASVNDSDVEMKSLLVWCPHIQQNVEVHSATFYSMILPVTKISAIFLCPCGREHAVDLK